MKLTIGLACSLLFILLIGTVGCRRAGPALPPPLIGKPGPSGTASFERIEGKVIHNRVDAHWASWDNQLALVVVCDFSGSSGSSSSNARYQWVSAKKDGNRRVDVRWETTDGKSGTVIINGQEFDRAQGPLFLVTTKDGQTRVRQLKRDFKGYEESLEELENRDEEVKRFVAEGEEP